MDVRTDFDALKTGDVVLLFFEVKGQQTAVVGQLWAFEHADGVRTIAWRETWAGGRIEGMAPYAYARIAAPDPAALGEDYG